jgi:hypothetical protein
MKRFGTQRVTLRLPIKDFLALKALSEKENDPSPSATARRVLLGYIRSRTAASVTPSDAPNVN